MICTYDKYNVIHCIFEAVVATDVVKHSNCKAVGRFAAEVGGREKVLQGAGTQPLQTYLYRRQATVAE